MRRTLAINTLRDTNFELRSGDRALRQRLESGAGMARRVLLTVIQLFGHSSAQQYALKGHGTYPTPTVLMTVNLSGCTDAQPVIRSLKMIKKMVNYLVVLSTAAMLIGQTEQT